MIGIDGITLTVETFIFDMTVFFRIKGGGGSGDWQPLCRFIEVTEEEF